MKPLTFLAATGAMLFSLATILSLPAHAAAAPSHATKNFVQTASMASQFEIVTSKLALQKSQNADVKDFAQQMVDDHTKAAADLKAALPSSSADPSLATDKLDAKHEKLLDGLKSASGNDFDRQYIAVQTKAHHEAVALFKDYSENGDDKVLKDFAGKTLPTLEKHLDHVKQLKAAS